MKILALDCGRSTGWACWHDGRVTYGTWDFSLEYGWSTEAAGWALQQHVADAITTQRLDHLALERPFGATAASMVESAGMSLAAAIVAFGRDLTPMWIAPSSIRKVFCRNGNAKKKAIMIECIRRGFSPANAHEADAISIAFAAHDRLAAIADAPA